jgi:hypothetical protein
LKLQAQFEPIAFVGGMVGGTAIWIAGGAVLKGAGLAAGAADLVMGSVFTGSAGVQTYMRTGDIGKRIESAGSQALLIGATVGAVKLGGMALDAVPKPVEISRVGLVETGYSTKMGENLLGSGTGRVETLYGYQTPFGDIPVYKVTNVLSAPLSSEGGVLAVPRASGGTDVYIRGSSETISESLFRTKTSSGKVDMHVFSQSLGKGEARLGESYLVSGEVIKSFSTDMSVPNPEFLDPVKSYGMGFQEGKAASVVSFGESSIDPVTVNGESIVYYKPRTVSGVDVNAGVARDLTASASERGIDLGGREVLSITPKTSEIVSNGVTYKVSESFASDGSAFKSGDVPVVGDGLTSISEVLDSSGSSTSQSQGVSLMEMESKAGVQTAVTNVLNEPVGVFKSEISSSSLAGGVSFVSKSSGMASEGLVSRSMDIESISFKAVETTSAISVGLGLGFASESSLVESSISLIYPSSVIQKAVSYPVYTTSSVSSYDSKLMDGTVSVFDNGYSGLTEKTVSVIPSSLQVQLPQYASSFVDVGKNVFEQPSVSIQKTPYKETFVNPNIDIIVNPTPFVPIEIIPNVPTPIIPISQNWPQGVWGAGKKRRGVSKGKHQYRPSITAEILGLRGSPSKGIFEGVGGFRPMPTNYRNKLGSNKVLNKVLGKRR